jgi:hypothetical protein
MYDRGRYLTMTGERLEGTLSSIEDRQAELEVLHRKVWPELYEARACEAPRAPSATERLTDEEVLGKALGAKNGEKFARLWMGDTSEYDDDDSRADMALCSLLAFRTQDPEQIDRLFRSSGLMRPKWDEPHYADGQTYGQKTIERASSLTWGLYAKEGNQSYETETALEERLNMAHKTEQRVEISTRVVERLLRIHAFLCELTSSPYSHDLIELTLAIPTSLPISQHDGSPLVAVGVPSADKTHTVLLLKSNPKVFCLDTLTEHSFISGLIGDDGEPRGKDLLEELQDKCLIPLWLVPGQPQAQLFMGQGNARSRIWTLAEVQGLLEACGTPVQTLAEAAEALASEPRIERPGA